MLRVIQQKNADAAKSYYAASDYLSEGQELVGEWGGKAAERLGLSGVVGKLEFDALCDNLHPSRGGTLTARMKDERTAGYDFNFSACKSFSALYALTGDTELLDAFRDSVQETMREDVEPEMKTRVRTRGQDGNRVTGNAAWASFYHLTSRPEDGLPWPQVHAHCFTFNTTWDNDEQRWKAGQFRDLKRDAPLWQSMFRVRLANKLQALGYGIERKGDDFEIAGVPASLIDKFSARTAKIERVAKEKGITDPAQKAELGAKTRAAKDSTLSFDELRREWARRLTDDETAAVQRTHMREEGRVAPELIERAAVEFAVKHAFEKDAVVDEKKLLAASLRYGLGRVTIDGVRRELGRMPLVIREVEGRRLATTPTILTEERAMVATVRAGRGTQAPLVGFERAIADSELTAEQRRAVRHVWESPDQYLFIRGAAGVGKTRLLSEVVAGVEEAGRHVTLLAQSASASRGTLRAEGFGEANTVARFLLDERMQAKARGQVVVVDEAGQLASRDMARLVQLADELEVRMVFLGDTRQHGSVQYGAPLKLLQSESGVPVVEVTEIQRQKPASYRRAVQALADGRTAEGFDVLAELGWVKEVPDAEREAQAALAYLATLAERKKGGGFKTALVVSPTHKEGERVTAAIRDALRGGGKLGEERTMAVWTPAYLSEAERGEAASFHAGNLVQFHKPAPGHAAGSRVVLAEGQAPPVQYAARFQVYRPAELLVAVGDRLRVTANGNTKDGKHRLNNGDLVSVAGFTARGDVVTDKGWVIDRQWGHLDHGYCVTSHAAQGRTVDRVFVCQSSDSLPASSAEQFYVCASRARESVTVLTDDARALRAAVQRSDTRMTATELARHPRPESGRWWRKHLAFLRRCANVALGHDQQSHNRVRDGAQTREITA